MKAATAQDVLDGKAQWCVEVGQWQDFLPWFPAASIDVTITDPPYAPRAMANFVTNSVLKQRREGKIYDFGYEGLQPWERLAVAQQIARITSRWAVVWCDIESDHLWRSALSGGRILHPKEDPHKVLMPGRFGMEYVRTGIWARTNPAPQFSGDRPGQAVESFVVTKQEDVVEGFDTFIVSHNHDSKKRWKGGGDKALYIGPIVNVKAKERRHSSPKPLWLMLRQVADYSNPGDLILDCYNGSGSTGAAAVRLGRRYIGIEKSKEWALASRKRIEAESRCLSVEQLEAKQTSIFDALERTEEEAA